MMEIASTRKNIALVIYTDGDTIRFTPLEKYNPRLPDARAPKFDGTFEECITYVREVL